MQESKARIFNIYKASSLTGNSVKNMAGENLGKIEELMINLEEGRIAYAVLSSGGVLGHKLFAVPWNALMLRPHDRTFIFDVDKERLQDAPGFDKDHWPDTANPMWDTPIRDYWEARKSGTTREERKDEKSREDLDKVPLA